MTRTLTLAALAFGLLALPAWNSARACGGYQRVPTAEERSHQEVESVVRTHFERHREHARVVSVVPLWARGTTPANEAQRLVRVVFARGEALFVQVLRLDNGRGDWRVVGGEPPLRA